MRLKQSIGALGALGLNWLIQLVLFAVVFALILVLLRQIAHALGAHHLPALILSCALSFLILAGVQAAARRRGWVGRAARHRPDW